MNTTTFWVILLLALIIGTTVALIVNPIPLLQNGDKTVCYDANHNVIEGQSCIVEGVTSPTANRIVLGCASFIGAFIILIILTAAVELIFFGGDIA